MWISAFTHTGQKRISNQDAFWTQITDDCCCAVVCDGMGGANGGAVASEIAVNTIKNQLSKKMEKPPLEHEINNILTCAGAAANIEIFDAAQLDSSLKGMGTTMTLCLTKEKTAYFLHAGDSRAYLLRDEILTQLTHDHTVVQALIDQGDLTKEQAKNHPQAHLITRAVGASKVISYDIFSAEILDDDAILLCSDGLYNYLADEDLTSLCSVCNRARSAMPLIDRANENGGGDNITAVLISIGRRECGNG